MPSSVVETDVYLALDIGSAFTRAFLFDSVEGQYRLIAIGQALSTVTAPARDALVGVEQALLDLQTLSGLHLLGEEGLIMPTSATGEGVDAVVGTLSCGRPLRVVIMGVLPQLSVASARRVVAGAYVDIVEVFTATDAATPEEQIQRLMASYPDLVLLVGGTDKGAQRAVTAHIDLLLWAVRLWPLDQRPWILFAGNEALHSTVQKRLGAHFEVRLAPNVRPSLVEENIAPAREAFLEIARVLWAARYPGLEDIHLMTQGRLTLSSYGFARLARYMQRLYAPRGRFLALDLGAAYLTAVWGDANTGDETLQTWPWGLGFGLAAWEEQPAFFAAVSAWAPIANLNAKGGVPLDYVHWKRWYPTALPLDKISLHMEETLARALLQQVRAKISMLAEPLDFLLAAGGVLSAAPQPQRALLTLLDGLQPWGLTTVLVDYAQMAAALGVLAELNEYVVVQVAGSAPLTPLATVLAPRWQGRFADGEPLADVRLHYGNDEELQQTLTAGALWRWPLAPGRRATLLVHPRRGVDVGAGPGRVLRREIVGSLLGIVFDVRGRPWHPASEAKARLQAWQQFMKALQTQPQEQTL